MGGRFAIDDSRTILHVDMDAFFASVEQLDDPELRGKPVLVGGRGRRGVVAAASYEARAFGCRSAMPTSTALRLCPHAHVVGGRGERYREMSDAVFEIMQRYTPLIEPLSIDEAFCDVTGSARLHGDGPTIARAIKHDVQSETGLVASVGVAPNKFLAKLASDLEKPDGLVVLTAGDAAARIGPLPVSRIFGIGPAAERKLGGLGVRSIEQLRKLPVDVLTGKLGSWGESVWRRAHGLDDREVVPDHAAKSIGHEQTFGENLEDPEQVRAVLSEQVEAVARRLRKKSRSARTVTLKIRFGDFETITRASTLAGSTDSTSAIWNATRGLFDAWAQSGFRSVRLIGVSVSDLSGRDGEHQGEQAGLFETAEPERSPDAATDAIVAKFGKGAIRRGRSLESPSLRHGRQDGLERKEDDGDA